MRKRNIEAKELILEDLEINEYKTIIDLMILFVFSDMDANDNELLVVNNFITSNQLDTQGITLEESLAKFAIRVENLTEDGSIADIIIDKMKTIDKSKSKIVLGWIKDLIYADGHVDVEEDELFRILLSELEIDNV